MNFKSKQNFGLNRGFTLVEMLLVLVILGVLAGIVYPNLTKHSLRARLTATKLQLKVFKNAISSFEMDNGHFPQGRNGLLELVQRPRDASNWRGPYLDGPIPKDPWEHDYLYDCPGKHNPDTYDLSSMGPDGVAGNEDDVTSWQPENSNP